MNIDAIIVFGYLIITLIYGLYVGRGVKNINDYALGGRNFTTPVLAATIIATYASSSGFFINLTKSYEDGLFKFLATSGQTVALLFTAFLISPRMKEFRDNLSVSEIMGKLFGNNIRIISSLPVILMGTGFLAIQIKVLSSILQYFTYIDHFLAVVIITSVITIYSTIGGIRAVTYTDFFQFATFCIVVPFIFMIVYSKLFSHNNIENKELLIHHLFKFDDKVKFYYIMLFILEAMPSVNAPAIQRMLMAKNTNQIRESFLIASFFLLILNLLTNGLGGLIYVSDQNIEPQNLLSYIINNYAFNGLKGLLIIGILAMAMSTADSYLNSSAVSFSHDFCKPLKFFHNVEQLSITRFFSIFNGILAMILALNFKGLLDIIFFVFSFYAPIVSVPLLLALFGFRSSERAVLAGMAFGILTVIFWESGMKSLGFENPISSFLPGMFAHMIGLFGTHYLFGEKGGWGQGPGSGPFNSPPKDFWERNSAENKNSNKESKFLNYNKDNLKSSFFNLLKKNLPQSKYLYNSLAFLNISLYSLAFIYLGDKQNQSLMLLLGVLLTSFWYNSPLQGIKYV